MGLLKKVLLGSLGAVAITGLCYFHAAMNPTVVVDARTGTNIQNGGPKGNSLQERIAIKVGTQMDQDGTWDMTQNSTNQRLVNVSVDATTWALGTATYFVTGSNTTATALGSMTNETAGDVFTIITSGGGNYSTIADNAGSAATSAFSVGGTGGWQAFEADANITFLVLGDNDYIQIGTSTAGQ